MILEGIKYDKANFNDWCASVEAKRSENRLGTIAPSKTSSLNRDTIAPGNY